MTTLFERCRNIRLLLSDVDGVMTDGRLHYGPEGEAFKSFHVLDGEGIKLLKNRGLLFGVITGRSSAMVTKRMEELQVSLVFQGTKDKEAVYETLLSTLSLSDEHVAYIGDDIIDTPLLRRVGLAVTVPNAHPRVKPFAHWQTSRSGGEGALRECCDFILESIDE